MALDGIYISNLAKELDEKLSGAYLNKVQEPSHYNLLFSFSIRGTNKLFISSNPSKPTCHLSTKKFTNPKKAPRFCMYLRKHLEGAKLNSVTCPDYERMLIFNFTHINELQDKRNLDLIVELVPRRANVVLVKDGVILDSLVYIDETMSRYRQILPTRPYEFPPKQDKPLAEDRIESLKQGELKGINEDQKLRQALLDLALGVSPQITKEILYRAEINKNSKLEDLDEKEKSALIKASTDVLTEAVYEPQAYIYPGAKKLKGDYHCFELKSLGTATKVESLNQAMDIVYNYQFKLRSLEEKRRKLLNLSKKELKHQTKLNEVYKADINNNENYEELEKAAELILSQLNNLPERVPQDGKLEIVDYYDPDLNTYTVNLEAGRFTNQAAEDLFAEYDKAKSAYHYGLEHIDANEANIDYLNSLINLLENADSFEDLDAIESEIESGPLAKVLKKQYKKHKQNKEKTQSKSQPKKAKPRHYKTSNSLDIFAGRNNLQNDNLSLRQSRKDDLWFHAKARPGSHLILKTSQAQEVKDEDILEAAEIAAYLSLKAKEKLMPGQEKLEIDYCPVSHLNKPKGAKPGLVTYKNYKTVYVEAKAHEDLKV